MSAFLNTVAPKETNHNYKATENYCKPIKSPSGFAVSDKVTFILKCSHTVRQQFTHFLRRLSLSTQS